jgi:hypothetical protein
VHGEDIGAAVCIGEHVPDRHLAAQRGICRFELDYFDNLLVPHQLHEAAVEGVGVRGRLAAPVGVSYVFATAPASRSAR